MGENRELILRLVPPFWLGSAMAQKILLFPFFDLRSLGFTCVRMNEFLIKGNHQGEVYNDREMASFFIY